MKHRFPFLYPLLLVAAIIAVSWKYQVPAPLRDESGGKHIIQFPFQSIQQDEPSQLPNDLSPQEEDSEVGLVERLLTEAGIVGEGRPLALPNPLGPPIAAVIQNIEQDKRKVFEVTGRLQAPHEGWFFLRRQQAEGKAGPFVGIIDIVGEDRVIELTGNEIVSRTREEVVCVGLPALELERIREAEGDDGYVPGAFLGSVLPGVDVNTIPIPSYQNGIVPLESLRGAKAVAYLDYDGESVSSWGGVEAAGYSMTPNEMLEVWERVSEDFAPFNINVTTDEAVYLAATESSRVRCIVTPTTDASPGAGGVAFLRSFNWEGDTPCWAFYRTGKSAAEVISHEIGHTLGLSHDGLASPEETVGYYSGHGSGKTAWAPLMGVGYYNNLTQWSKGEYDYANNTQDDLAIITTDNNEVDYREDDHGDSIATASPLEIFDDTTVVSRGILEKGTDVDAFQFTSLGGSIALTVEPLTDGANVDLSLTLVDHSGTTLLSDQPAAKLTAAISGTLAAGDYTVLIAPAGKDNATTGYTTYGCIGHFEITGTVANAMLPSRLDLVEHSANGTTIGNVVVDNPNSASLSYSLISGNDDGAFALSNNGVLSVLDNTLLDYETRPQWDLSVNVINSQNSAYNVIGHRVVISLTNVNEAPVFLASAPSLTFLENTKLGTEVYRATAVDPDTSSILSYAIVDGDSTGIFGIDASNGQITIAGTLVQPSGNTQTLTVQVSDSADPPAIATQSIVINVGSAPDGFVPGTIRHTIWTDIAGTLLTDLTTHASYPESPDSETELPSFEAPTDLGDNFGAVMRGYLIPATSGDYTFALASDDQGELLLSTDASPANVSRIANVPEWTYEREWDYYSSQRSSAISLVAGQAYYIEARMKEGGGGDNLAVGWHLPGGTFDVIPGRLLAPFYHNYSPSLQDHAFDVYEHAIGGVHVGTITGSDLNTEETLTYTIESGNAAGIFELDSLSGALRIADAAALASASGPQSLTVRATDHGSPSMHVDASVTVTLIAEGTIQTTALVQEIWDDITGSSLSDLTSNARYPTRSDRVLEHTSFDTGKNLSDNYGSRIRAFVTPTAAGDYTFSITSDDASELWLSTDTAPDNAVMIASISNWAGYDNWTKYPSQTSSPITLAANTSYYIETRHKEGGGGDHVRVAWVGGTIASHTVIAENYLTPVDINLAPQLPNTLTVTSTSANTIVGSLNASDSAVDSLTYELLSGDDADFFQLHPNTGALTLLNPTPLQALGALAINVRVQDSGMSGRFSPRTAQATVRVVLQESAHAGESIIYSGLTNAARNPGAVASQTTTDFQGEASRAIDGDVTDYFSSGSVTHSAATQPNEAWQVDLGDPCQIHEIVLYNRGDTLGYRLTNFEVCVYLDGKLVWAQDCHTEGTHVPDGGLLSLSGFQWLRGDTVEIRLLGDTPRYLSLAEVEVYATDSPTGSEVAYERWAAQLHQLNPKDDGGMADTDEDGMKNLYEFAVNANPTASETDAGIESETVEDGEDEWVEVQFRRRRDHSDIGLDYAVEFNESLTEAAWSSGIAATESSVVPNADGITETVTVRCQLPLSGDRERLFARLMVSD